MSPLDDTETTKILMQMTGDLGHIKSLLETQSTQIIELKTEVKEINDKGCGLSKVNKESIAGMKKHVYGITGIVNAISVAAQHLFRQ